MKKLICLGGMIALLLGPCRGLSERELKNAEPAQQEQNLEEKLNSAGNIVARENFSIKDKSYEMWGYIGDSPVSIVKIDLSYKNTPDGYIVEGCADFRLFKQSSRIVYSNGIKKVYLNGKIDSLANNALDLMSGLAYLDGNSKSIEGEIITALASDYEHSYVDVSVKTIKANENIELLDKLNNDRFLKDNLNRENFYAVQISPLAEEYLYKGARTGPITIIFSPVGDILSISGSMFGVSGKAYNRFGISSTDTASRADDSPSTLNK